MATLIRSHYDPFTAFDRLLYNALNARLWYSPSFMVRRATTTGTLRHLDSFRPRMDVEESEESNAVTATFELPGLKPEDVSVDLHQDRLTISGESSSSGSCELDGCAVRERRHGKFSRTLRLPSGTKPEDVKAKLGNGLLTVTFPKAIPEQQSQRITIQ